MPPVHDYVISNGTGAAVRSDLNGALAAIVSNNSSASEPSPTYAYMWWADTTTGLLKQRNSANAAWITIGTLASTNLGLLSLAGGTLTGALLADDSGTVALPAIAFDGDTNTGIFRAGADQFNIATNGVERVEFGNTEVVFNDDGADVDFRVEGDTNANLFKIDAGLDEVQVANLNGGPLAGTRNRIINGDMRIDQRNAGAVVTVTDAYVIDRWKFFEATDGAASCQRVADVPAGFTNSAKITITTADSSLAASQRSLFFQQIEGLNTDDLAFGTASAKTIALSFWVKSSVTGAFGGCLMNGSGTRSYPFSYAISSANTWEQKSVIVPGETTGTWTTDNTSGLQIIFCLGTGTDFIGTANTWSTGLFNAPTGSTNLFDTLNATWQITGVQLEPGTVATPFERRSYGQELALCQRYYSTLDRVVLLRLGNTGTYGGALSNFTFSQTMRAAPSVTRSVNGGNYDDPVFDVGTSGGYMYYGSGTNVGDYVNFFLRFSAEL